MNTSMSQKKPIRPATRYTTTEKNKHDYFVLEIKTTTEN